MIYDHRTYICRPGMIKKHLELYGTYGYPTQRRILGVPVMFAQVETGDVNSFVHVWRYDDATDRAERRKQLAADADWQDYLKRSAEAGYLVSQINKILTPAPFVEG